MSTHDREDDACRPGDVTEQNIHRLLGQAYHPDTPDPAFARRLTDELCVVARESAHTRHALRRAEAFRASRRQRFGALAAAASLTVLAVGLYLLEQPGPKQRAAEAVVADRGAGREPARQQTRPLLAQKPAAGRTPAEAEELGLTPRPLPPGPALETVALGIAVSTAAGERRRVGLPDGSVLSLNENTTVRAEAGRQVALDRGEVFVEVAPRPPGADGATFLVKTKDRQVAALGTKFDVRAGDAGTAVAVTQGGVRVEGLDRPVWSGQELKSGHAAPAPAPQASYLLDWTRDLRLAAEPPLLPHNPYAGGALVAVAPGGPEAALSLRRYHVDVYIEDGFARTTIDQTYFNPEGARREGTFYFPLPADASLSRLAMYVNGRLMEGGMAERDHARQAFEDVVRRMKDPALLEWVDGTTFQMRVFPLEPRQEKRIVLSYTQRLPSLYGRYQYRFPAGHSLGRPADWSFHARVKNGAAFAWNSPSHGLRATAEGHDLLLDGTARDVKADRDVVLDLTDKGVKTGTAARFASAELDGSRYLMLRYRPELPGQARRQRRDWVFLFESSGDRDPVLARVQVEVVRTLLENAEHDDTFAVLTAGTEVRRFAGGPVPATPQNVRTAVAFLERTHLVGALDLGKALAAAGPFLEAGKNPYLVHLGSGLPALGERGEDVLARRLPAGTHYVGVAVGKRWARGFMKSAADRSGGYVAQINPDEPVSWRAFELLSTLNAPRLLNVQVVDNTEKVRFLTCAGTLAQGEELCAAARTGGAGELLPESLTVSGTLDGKPYRQVIQVKDVTDHAGYLPRTWAKMEIDRLLADGADKNKAAVVALSKNMYVMTPFTSLLVLENEAMYAQYNVDRGRKDHWALYPCPETVPVVREPRATELAVDRLAAPAAAAAPAAKPSAEQVLQSILVRVPPQVLRWPGRGDPTGGRRVVTAQELYAGAIALPEEEEQRALGRDDEAELLKTREPAAPPGAKPGRATGIPAAGDTYHGQGAPTPKAMPATAPAPTPTPTPPPPPAPSEAAPTGRAAAAPAPRAAPAMKMAAPAAEKGGPASADDTAAARRSFDKSKAVPEEVPPEAKDTRAPTRDTAGLGAGGGSLGRAASSAPGGSGGFAPQGLGGRMAPGSGGGGAPQGGLMPSSGPSQGFGGAGMAPAAGNAPTGGPGSGGVGGFGGMAGGQPYGNFAGGFGGFGGFGGGMQPGYGYGNFTGALGGMAGTPPTWDLAYRIGRYADTYNRFSLPYYANPFAFPQNGSVYLQPLPDAGAVIIRRSSPGQAPRPETGVVPLRDIDPEIVEAAIRAIQNRDAAPADPSALSKELGSRKGTAGWKRSAALRQELKKVVPDEGRAWEVTARRAGQELMEAGDGWLGADGRAAAPRYERPSYSRDDRLFWDLPAYAPGLNTGRADVEAVLEAEAAGGQPTPGAIDPEARRPIDRARAAGWRSVTVPGRDGKPLLRLVCDGQGRYAYRHTLPAGLVEHVVCDGTTLLHLYPDLGLGARRAVSRFHRADFQALVPWALPPVEDLTHDADVRRVDERTVAVVPHDPTRDGLQLVFADDGRLAERRRVARPAGTVLARETYAADGTVRILDADGRETSARRFAVADAAAPDLGPDTRQLVVLPLPLRTRDHVFQVHPIAWDGNYAHLDPTFALELIAGERGDGNDEVRQVILQRFVRQGDGRPGFLVLLAAAGLAPDRLPPPTGPAGAPVTRYLAWLKGRGTVREAGAPPGLGDGLFGRLAGFHALARPWQRGDAGALQGDEEARLLAYLRAGRSPALTWALADLVLGDRTRHTDLPGGLAGVKRRVLEAACASLADVPVLGYVARYERARLCWQDGDRDRARELFRDAYRRGEQHGLLPPIDATFREALGPSGGRPDDWTALLRQSAGRLLDRRHYLAALALAHECAVLDDPRLADDLSAAALRRLKGDPERLPVSLDALDYFWHTHQYGRADGLLRDLLADRDFAGRAALWRLAARLAGERRQPDRERECLDRALALEFQHRPAEVDLVAVRRDYGTLLGQYERLADALGTLHQPPAKDFVGRVVGAADRWRALDVDGTAACLAAARILKAVGRDDLAWDYLTTPLAGRPGEATAALELARGLSREGSVGLADRAYRLAAEADPTNAQVLWERVQNLQQAGKPAEARQVLRRLAEETWPEQYQELQRQARARLDGAVK